jgi:hypothetical protein
MKKLLLVAILLTAVFSLQSQADFFQCPPSCTGSDNDDVVIGSAAEDDIDAGPGNDFIFGGDSRDILEGGDGNDVIFGGLGSDLLVGIDGDDTLLPGPDSTDRVQNSLGNVGNDTFIIFAGETVNCQFIRGERDFDVLHLIGFGPFIAEYPFGAELPFPDEAWIIFQDPIAGGFILVQADRPKDNIGGIERIHGLPTPNVVPVDLDTGFVPFVDANCIGF